MKRLLKHINHIKLLGHCDDKLRRAILKNSDKELIVCLCECVLNFLSGNLKTGDTETKKLESYKNTLRQLILSKGSVSSKRNILVQKGGFLPFIIPAIIDLTSRLLNQ